MDKGLTWASGVSVLGIAAMSVIALVVEPPLVALEDLPRHMGATVTVEGVVTQADVRAEGLSRLTVRDGNRSVDLLLERPVDVSTGDRVRVTGQVSAYAGRIQLQIETTGDITLLRPWRDNHVPLDRLLESPWQQMGLHVRTSGLLEDRRLATPDGRQSLVLRGPLPMEEGAYLVDGLLEYDATRSAFLLRVAHVEPA